MKHKFFLERFFATLMLCAVFSLSWAYDFEVDKICYTVNEDGTSVTIESSSNIYSNNLVIPSNVTSGGKTYTVTNIGKNAFSSNYFSSITLPETLVTIGRSAFYGHRYLTTIVIPNGVTYIGDRAFSDCSSLTSVTIPESVVDIGMYAFAYCSKLKNITLPGNVAIGSGAFSGCDGLPVEDGIRYADTYMVAVVDKTKTSYSFRSGVRNLCSFQGCSNLTSISIPKSVKRIDESTFSDCSALSTLYISESVESIDESAFKGCAALNSISVAAGNPIYDSRDNCNAIINTTSNTLVVGCKGTVIPNTIAYIGKHAFEGSSITNISIPNGVVSVYKDAFRATSLKSIDIPNSVVYIGDNAFAECTALSSVTCMAESVPTLGDGVFKEGSQSTATLYVPASALTSYRSASQWRAFGNILSIDGDNPDTPEPATTFQGAKYIFGENLLQSLSDGRIHTFYYDNNGFLTRIERQDGGSIDKVFNVSYGDEITFTYSNSTYVITLNERGFVKSCDNSNDNEHAEFQYNDDDQLVYVDWDGHITNITYTDGDITRVKDGNDTYGFVYETANQGKMENKAHVMEFDRIFEVDLDYFGLLYYGGFLGKATAHLPLTRTNNSSTLTSTWTLDSKGYGVHLVGSDNNELSWSWKEGGEVRPVPATSIALDKTEAGLKSGEGVQLTATILPKNADQRVTWSSSDESVATVSEDGYVTAVAVGTVTITATTKDGTNLSAQCAVTVEKSDAIEEKKILLSADNMSEQSSYSSQYCTWATNAGTSTDGIFRLELTGRTDKKYSQGKNITIDYEETSRTVATIMTSNGAENTLTLPEGFVATNITFWGYTCNYHERLNYWAEVAGQRYTEETAPRFFGESTEYDPYKVSYDLQTPANVVTFTNQGSQQSIVIEVTYRPKNNIDPEGPVLVRYDGIDYNLNDQDHSATVYPCTTGKYSGNVVVPATISPDGTTYTVTKIHDMAFYQCSEMTSVTLPETLTSIGEWAFKACRSLTTIYCYATTPPMLQSDAFVNLYYTTTLYVPLSAVDAYKDQWSMFFGQISSIDDSQPEPSTKCATPVISYSNGKITFSCSTPGAKFNSRIACSDVKKYTDIDEIDLCVTYVITVTAHSDLLDNSDPAEGTLCWLNTSPETDGIISDVTEMLTPCAQPVLIQSRDGVLSISGVDEDIYVGIYDTSGRETNSTIFRGMTMNIDTRMKKGSIAIVKMGNKAVKVLVR